MASEKAGVNDEDEDEFGFVMLWAISKVLQACSEAKMIPAVLIAVKKTDAAVLPCGPGLKPRMLATLLAKAANDMDKLAKKEEEEEARKSYN